MAATNRSTLTDIHVSPSTENGCPPIADVDITEIYCPVQDVPIIADIVFVHGLKGHPRDTWLYGKQNPAQSTAAPECTARKSSFRTKIFGRSKSVTDHSGSSSPRVVRRLRIASGLMIFYRRTIPSHRPEYCSTVTTLIPHISTKQEQIA